MVAARTVVFMVGVALVAGCGTKVPYGTDGEDDTADAAVDGSAVDAPSDDGEEEVPEPGDDCPDVTGVLDCDLECWVEAARDYLGDGVCDAGERGPNFNCEELNFDGTDCVDPPADADGGPADDADTGAPGDGDGDDTGAPGDADTDGGAADDDGGMTDDTGSSDGGPSDGGVPEECDGIEDCSGACVDDLSLVSGWGNGVCDAAWNCAVFALDFGDCDAEEVECLGTDASPEMVDCMGGCVEVVDGATRMTNGVCDLDLNCSTWAFDAGDCEGPGTRCETIDGGIGIWDCEMHTCRDLEWLGDSYCDDDWGRMDCAETGWDGGDCPPDVVSSSAPTGDILGESDPTSSAEPVTE